MKNLLNKELVEGLNNSSNEEFQNNVNEIVYSVVSQAIEDISAKSPFVRIDSCVLLPVNEISTGAFTQLSQYDYFLGIDNPQIETNSQTRKNFWKYVWREFRASWRLGKKKYKKKKFEETSLPSVEKYKLSDFRHDIVFALSQYFTETTVIYENMGYVSIVGNVDLGTGVKVNLYVCIYDSTNNRFKLYNEIKNSYTLVDFGSRQQNLDYKTQACGKMFTDILKLINTIFSKNFDRVPNQILVESMVFACPNKLFDKKDVYKTFVNVANYILLSNPKNIVSICNPQKNIFEEPLILGAGSQIDFTKIISMFEAFKY